MKKYQNLIIPETVNDKSKIRQQSYCELSICKTVNNCQSCLFDPENIEIFKQWEKESNTSE